MTTTGKLNVCSFLPAATEMIYQMGLEKHLRGVTFECHSDKPKVVRSYIEGNNFNGLEIEKIVAQLKSQGKSLYYIIFTQDVCDVCQVDTARVQGAVYKLKKQPLLIPLSPKNLKDVLNNLITIAAAMGNEAIAYKLLASLNTRTNKILDILRANKAPLRRVMLMEWMNPIYNCGHWILPGRTGRRRGHAFKSFRLFHKN
jgi:iron complex transport system substrate-binding protein